LPCVLACLRVTPRIRTIPVTPSARVKPSPDIFKLNPDAQTGVRENQVLLIPVSGVAVTTKASPVKHTVQPKETLYSLSRQYNISVDEIRAANPEVAAGLKIGQVVTIPVAGSAPVANVPSTPKPSPEPTVTQKPVASQPSTANGATYHVVEPKETKFGIAKRYGLTVSELEKLNPGIESNLPIGYRLKVTQGAAVEKPAPKVVTLEEPKPVEEYQVIKTTTKTSYANYEVKPKETLYSLAKEFGTTEEELIRLNPMLKEGVKVGMILKVPGKGSMTLVKEPESQLAGSLSKDSKRLVMLLPFNASRIQGDTAKTLSARLKKDAFLNMTLDFYSGALVAIDSARALGLNVEVTIKDSEESVSGSKINDLARDRAVRAADVVIGPFYQQYAEKLAESLMADSIPVVSPLSKEAGTAYPNLYQAMPSANHTKNAMLRYMLAKQGNVVVVCDPKRVSNKEFIAQNYPEVRFAPLDENGNFVPENLKSLLVKDKLNYVVLDTEKTGMILSVTNLMLNEMGNYRLQLAIIEPNETLDYEEISMKRLTLLKLLYPSVTRENASPEAQIFENAYRKQNKVFPNPYAVRGFDVTFDTLLRMAQPEGFSAAATKRTEQVQSRFGYTRAEGNGFMNDGIYILEFQEDLSVKEAQ
jgi:LysM repeat protein